MNCAEVRECFPELLYEEASSDQAARLNEHLHQCSACQGEFSVLQDLRRMLDVAPTPKVAINFSQLYRQAVDQRERRVRRWRRAALALVATAAGLLVVLGLRLEVRLEANQLAVRWGSPPQISEATSGDRGRPAPDPTPIIPQSSLATAEDVQLLRKLIYALEGYVENVAADVQSRDRRQQEALALIQNRLAQLRARTEQDRVQTKVDFDALYFLNSLQKKERTNEGAKN